MAFYRNNVIQFRQRQPKAAVAVTITDPMSLLIALSMFWLSFWFPFQNQ